MSTLGRGWLISYINIYHLFADPALYHIVFSPSFGRLDLRLWRWNMIDSEMEWRNLAEARSNTHNKRSLIRTPHICHRRRAAGRNQQVEEYKNTHTRTYTNVSNWKIKWEKIYCFERLCLWYHPSQKETTCSKLATQAQVYGVKIVED